MGGSEALHRLMLITDRRRARGRDLVDLVARAVGGGVGIVQIREKDLPDEEIRELIRRIRDRVPADTRISVNDRWRVARTAGVGLHLPAGRPLPEGGPVGLLGRSAHDVREARAAVDEGVDYVVLGTLFPTPSKPGHPGAGPGLVREVCAVTGRTPVYAIGGIQVSHVPDVIHAGAHGVAVCGAILSASDPRRVAEAFALALAVTGEDPAKS